MEYNYRLQSYIQTKFNSIKEDRYLNYFVFKLSNYSNLKSFRYCIKKSMRDIRNSNYLTNRDIKYLGVIETSSLLTKQDNLFEPDIIDLGLHIHLFVSSSVKFEYDFIRYPIVNTIGNHIISKYPKVSLWVGNELNEMYDLDKFILYHSKQFCSLRNEEFIIVNY